MFKLQIDYVFLLLLCGVCGVFLSLFVIFYIKLQHGITNYNIVFFNAGVLFYCFLMWSIFYFICCGFWFVFWFYGVLWWFLLVVLMAGFMLFILLLVLVVLMQYFYYCLVCWFSCLEFHRYIFILFFFFHLLEFTPKIHINFNFFFEDQQIKFDIHIFFLKISLWNFAYFF